VAYVQDENGIPNPNFGDSTVPESGYNNFSNNTDGIRNDSSIVFKAENNYWGLKDDSGIGSYNFIGDTDIDYTPWLNSPP